MKNWKRWMLSLCRVIGIFAIITITFTVIACSDGSDDGGGTGGLSDTGGLNGTWIRSDGYELKLNNGNYEESSSNIPWGKGTYTVNGERMTFKRTHLWGEGIFNLNNEELGARWYTQAELDSRYAYIFSAETATFSLSGNTLTINWEGMAPYIFTRK